MKEKKNKEFLLELICKLILIKKLLNKSISGKNKVIQKIAILKS